MLAKIAAAWQKDHEQILDTANNLTRQLSTYSGGEVATVELSALQNAYKEMRGDYDATNGGFGGAPKYPRPVALEYLMRYSLRGENEGCLDMTMHRSGRHGKRRNPRSAWWRLSSLCDRRRMARAPFREDAVRPVATSTRLPARVPDHAQRRLCSNDAGYAGFRLARNVKSDGWLLFGPRCRQSVAGTASKVARGAYDVWSARQVKELLGSDAPAFQYRYGVQPDGNIPEQQDIEGQMRGMNVLYRQHSLAATASYFIYPPKQRWGNSLTGT